MPVYWDWTLRMAAPHLKAHLRRGFGKLDKNDLGIDDRVITRMVNAPEGNFRDWDAIRAWAREIAATL